MTRRDALAQLAALVAMSTVPRGASAAEVSVPSGYGADGIPALNLSVVGLPGEDAQVLAWAHAFERQAPRFEAPPRHVA